MRPGTTFVLFALLGVIVGSVVGGGLSLRLRYDDVRAEVELQKRELESRWEMKEVAVLGTDLEPGDRLESQDIRTDSLPAQFVTPSFLSPEEAHALAGNAVATNIATGDVLTRQLIFGADGGVSCLPVEFIDAYVAKRPISKGPLDGRDFKRVELPKALYSPAVITSLIGRDGEELTADLEEGELLLEVHFRERSCAADSDGGTVDFAEDEGP